MMAVHASKYLGVALMLALVAFRADAGSHGEVAANKPPAGAKHRFTTEEITIDPGPPRWFAEEGTSTYVATMGTSTPSPNPYRFGAAGAVIVNEMPYLIDAGEGILRAIAKTATAHDKRLVHSFPPAKLTHLFLTHLHSDHVVGLPSLILNPWIFGKRAPMEIYGPVGTKNLVDKILDAYQPDIRERIDGPEGSNDTGWRVNVHEFTEDGVIFKDDKVTVEAFAHEHGTLPSYALRFVTADRVVVWAGDGKQGAAFQAAAKDADILVSEMGSEDTVRNSPWGGMSPEEKERVVWSYHIKPRDLAELATKARVKRLVLIHESNYSDPYDPEALLKEIKQFYKGDVISSRDGDVF